MKASSAISFPFDSLSMSVSGSGWGLNSLQSYRQTDALSRGRHYGPRRSRTTWRTPFQRTA